MIPLPAIRRILVALDASHGGEAALEAAALLAAHMEVELAGIFVENEDVLRFAALPFTRETGVASAATRKTDRQEVERLLKVRAGLAEAALVREAERQRLRWSFEVRRGRVMSQLLADAESEDLLALAREGALGHGLRAGTTVEELLPGRAGAVLMLPARAKLAPPLTVIYEESPPGAAALTLAGRIARGTLDGVVRVLVPVPPSPAAARRIEAQAREDLARLPVVAEMKNVPCAPPAAFAAAVRAARPGTLVMGWNAGLARALQSVDVPLIVVRPERRAHRRRH
ncbi:MAG: hypothetical protein HY749_17715 [Gammaproteobacteria bacterium]|nr:hypothetical protein [Gammaproteobacteria bacterium]MBI5615943.1 hypothetical protein [Gammaproteobacteria bacterium]